MKRIGNIYPNISDFYHIISITDRICSSVRNKKKVDRFESFKIEHIYNIYKRLHNRCYQIGL